jgi:uncharacterized membrane protein YGL010W
VSASTAYARLSADYGDYHRTPGNRRCHAVGIPLIVYALTAWSRVHGVPVVAVLLPLYFAWDARVGLLMTAFLAACAGLASVLPAWTSAAAFVVGWAFQFAGHSVCEKRSPAFLKNVTHLLIGPAWVASELAALRRPVA